MFCIYLLFNLYYLYMYDPILISYNLICIQYYYNIILIMFHNYNFIIIKILIHVFSLSN